MADNELKITDSKGQRLIEKGVFKLILASQLSLSDDFLQYIPKTPIEKRMKRHVQELIKEGPEDFYCSSLDPSFDVDGQICYQVGMKPAVGKSYAWWAKEAKNFCPERKSRLGTYSEYILSLAVLTKEMVAAGKSLEWAWNCVCKDSEELGHYRNSSDARNDFETTGSREVCGRCDLANTYKLLAEEEEANTFWIAGGCYACYGRYSPLVLLKLDFFPYDTFYYATGWLVIF